MKKFTFSIFVLFIISSCGGGGGGGGGGGSSIPLPSISISANTTNVNLDDSIELNWNASNATSCSATGDWTGVKANSGNVTIVVSKPGSNTFGLSCTGEGGSSSRSVSIFAFDIGAKNTNLSTDEDVSITNASVAVEPNEDVTVSYSLVSTTSNGYLSFNDLNATVSYTPISDFNGTDQFTFKVSIPEKSLEKDIQVTINVVSVNDAPTITLDSASRLTKLDIVYDINPIFNFAFIDVDNNIDELTFSAVLNDFAVPATFTQIDPSNGSLRLDISSIPLGGLFNLKISVFDGVDTATQSMQAWFAADRSMVSFEQDDDPEDGTTEGLTTLVDYNVYYIDGNAESKGRTTYLFVADSLANEEDRLSFRSALARSLNKVKESDARNFFSGFFTIKVAEPVIPDGKSPSAVKKGCYDFDPNIYCIGEQDTSVFDVMYPDHLLVSTLTMLQGRGVNLGNRNIQPINNRTENVLMHELGHAHGFMGDEYRTDDDRDVSYWADLNVNTTTQSVPALVKWSHQIPDLLNVLGRDVLVCYNWEDGTIADFDDIGIVITDCDCFVNIWDENGNFVGKNPECSKVGLFEGNYYGLYDNYRPTFCSIMDSCSAAGYQKVNAEGFAVGSIHNQGFYDSDSVDFVTDSVTGDYTAFSISIDGELNTSMLSLKWYVNGVEDTSKRNQLSVSFSRPPGNGINIYTYRITDLTGTITAPDDVQVYDDFYEGLFNSDFWWNGDDGWDIDPVDKSNKDYGYMEGPLGASWGVNWARW